MKVYFQRTDCGNIEYRAPFSVSDLPPKGAWVRLDQTGLTHEVLGHFYDFSSGGPGYVIIALGAGRERIEFE